MKNKYMTFVALAVAALATSCTSDDLAGQNQIQNQSSSQTVTLTASVDDEQTRVGMTKDENTAKFYWHNGDAISVLTENGSSYGNAKFTTTADNGATTAEFTGNVTGTGKYALYPYSENHKLDENGTTYNLPASYKYDKVESKIFGTDADYLANSTNMPMLGTIASGNITFKHLGGLAVIRIDKMPAASGTLTVTADQQLSGNFTVGDLTGTPNIATTSTNVTNADKKVTFTFSNATADGVGVFYLPLATGTYNNVRIVLNCGAVNQTINWGTLTVACANVTAVPVVANKVINGHVFVDLGLPSGLLWATMNIGATVEASDNANSYGSYFAWGETETKEEYMDYTYKNTSKDAASVLWGSPCRMPTQAEFEELVNKSNCTYERTRVNWGYGYRITSKKYTYNSIFLPAAGYYDDDDEYNEQYGYYWSSTLSSSKPVSLYHRENGIYIKNDNLQKYYGASIRPVAKK